MLKRFLGKQQQKESSARPNDLSRMKDKSESFQHQLQQQLTLLELQHPDIGRSPL
jgi:hypothetical protein